MTSVDLEGVDFRSRFYYVHLHGLELDDDLSDRLRKGMTTLNGHLLPPHYFFLDGYITFISSHSALPSWACDLSHKKQNSVIDNLKKNHHTILAKTYNFVDDHSARPHQKYICSLQLLHPKQLLEILPDPPAHLLEIVRKPEEDIQRFILQEINTFCLLLRILGFSIITPFITNVPYTNFFTNRQKVFMNSLDDAEVRRSFKGNEKKLMLQDINWIKENFSWLHNKSYVEKDQNMNAFEIPFQMITNDIYAVDPKVRFFTAWNGIESLLKPGSKNIGPNIINRMTSDGLINKKKARRIYQYRNKIIHGDIEFLNKHGGKLPKMALETRILLCKLVKFFIENEIIPTKEYLDEQYGVLLANDRDETAWSEVDDETWYYWDSDTLSFETWKD